MELVMLSAGMDLNYMRRVVHYITDYAMRATGISVRLGFHEVVLFPALWFNQTPPL